MIRRNRLNELPSDNGKTKRKRGRPSKKTAELEEIVIRGVSVGLSQATCALLCGIDESTLQRWIAKDESLRQRVHEARGEARLMVVARLMERIKRGCQKSIVFWLSRRCPEFQRRDENLLYPDTDVADGNEAYL